MTYPEQEYRDNVSVTSMHRKMNNIFGSTDKGFHELKRANKNGVIKNVGFFITGLQGSSIRNAVTGVYTYKHKVGTFDQDLYFSVIIATGETKGYREPIILYYDSPEQYEKHFFLEIDKETKEKWTKKRDNQLLKQQQ